MERHVMLSGEVIEYEAPPASVAAFLERVRTIAEDPAVTEAQIVDVLYGPDNPLLQHGVIPGRGLVTKATLADPVWHAMLDLLDRKRMQRGSLDLAAAKARFTMTVSEAAAELGVTSGAVRQAIAARTLPAWRQGGRWLLDPATVEAYRVTGRRGSTAQVAEAFAKIADTMNGAAETFRAAMPVLGDAAGMIAADEATHPLGAELDARIGSASGASFRLKAPARLVDAVKEAAIITGALPAGWRRIAVHSGAGADAAFFELEPGDEDNVIERDGFYLRGHFRVARKIVGFPPRAGKAFSEFRPE